MAKKNKSVNSIIILSLIALILIVVSIRYLDDAIAAKVMHFILSIRTLHKATQHIPDILPHLVALGTITMWLIYFFKFRGKKQDRKSQFLRLAATTLPVAYLLKSFFKFAFGRTTARAWLLEKKPLEFHWFDKMWSGSFPSGHMTVFAAFGAAVWIYYPRYRRIVIILLVLLGIALIGTDYHFLSDVIAGTYLGVITTYTIQLIFEKNRGQL